ncbi:N-acetylmuramoyl-L-alanine amidase [Kordiimonas aquimaris]|uniref:N-acetylmuramoyl-L-alanine amidase n=1 Tax=Kordiimonas aquimaris TaxID=707591 RepID=UPI002942C31B|nr:N-acetylmuramoyl-L-alanine amidase [Kordiimonas aquimaris]
MTRAEKNFTAMIRHIVVLLTVIFVQASISAASSVDVEGVRFGENASATRFVIDLSGTTSPSVFMLADPYRIVIDLPNASWKGKADVKPIGVVDGYRHGLFSDDTYRIVLDLKQPAVVANAFSLPAGRGSGPRYVIDIKKESRSKFLQAVASSKPERPAVVTRATPEIASPRRRAAGKRVIVLDPGHGGPDPGNLGVIGVHEKVITLKIARAIRDELNKTGRYEVHLTRDRDIFHKVRERFRIARRHKADLFISIHADSIQNPKVNGGSVYNLSENASDKEAERLAARENKSDLIAGLDLDATDDTLTGILIDLAQRETLNYSAQFAEILVSEMRTDVPMLRRAHRFANLGMLKAPDVPSVLLEAGYLTNKTNARFLNSKNGQRRIAQAVRRAIDRYFAELNTNAR